MAPGAVAGAVLAESGDQPEEMEQVTPEVRAAHGKAFEEAVAVLENEVSNAPAPGQAVALLAGVRNEFELWEDGQLDGPMPLLTTAERLRAKFRYVLVGERQWKQATDYSRQVHRIFDSHMGGGTSMSYKLFNLFGKGLAKVSRYLNESAYEDALCEAVRLTKAMVDNDEWYSDTDLPEEVDRLVRRLGAAWGKILFILEGRAFAMLTAWLQEARQEWEGPAADHLGTKLTFNIDVPKKDTADTQTGSTPKKATAKQAKDNPGSGAKKRKPSQPASVGTPTKRARAAPASAETETWIHRLDHELKHRQASAVQLRCKAEGGGQKRVLVVSGAYPLKAVGKAIATAFNNVAAGFDPHPNKGTTPPGLRFALRREDGEQALKPLLKIVQAVQEPGDVMVVAMDRLVVTVALDAIKFKADAGFDHVKDRPMPRCVGGDGSFGPQFLKRLNRTFLHDRKPKDFVGCSQREAVAGTLEEMARPIALRQGAPVVEVWPRWSGLAREGELPGDALHPIVV